MTVLSAQSIRSRKGMITPFCERTGIGYPLMTYGLGPAGYDVRIAEWISMDNNYYHKKFKLVSTIEQFNIPDDVIAIVHDKSSWARKGLFVQNTVIEPGWKGFLTLELSYVLSEILHIPAGLPIAQIVFHRLDEPTELPYKGKYQNQESGPQPAR